MRVATVEVIDVSKCFGEVVAVNKVSLKIGSGEFYSLLGPSGCGKTTLLRMIAGFEEPSGGRIVVSGRDMVGVPPHKRPVNLVFQSYALFPHLSVFENVAFGLKATRSASKSDIPQLARGALELVRLQSLADRFPRELSGGQQQRVALARAIVNKPAVLLLDEPLSALDLKIRLEMQEELSRLQRQLGITFVLVTHDQAEALSLSDHIALIYQGNVEQVGSPAKIYNEPQTAFVADFIGHANLFAAELIDSRAPYLLVRAPGGLELWVKENPQLPAMHIGTSVTVWIRTQSLSVSSIADGQPFVSQYSPDCPRNAFAAMVTHRSYQGSTTSYGLMVCPELSLKASCLQFSPEFDFAVGQKVMVRLPADAASVFPQRLELSQQQSSCFVRQDTGSQCAELRRT